VSGLKDDRKQMLKTGAATIAQNLLLYAAILNFKLFVKQL